MPFCLSPRLLLARRLFAAVFEPPPDLNYERDCNQYEDLREDTVENPTRERSHSVAAP